MVPRAMVLSVCWLILLSPLGSGAAEPQPSDSVLHRHRQAPRVCLQGADATLLARFLIEHAARFPAISRIQLSIADRLGTSGTCSSPRPRQDLMTSVT